MLYACEAVANRLALCVSDAEPDVLAAPAAVRPSSTPKKPTEKRARTDAGERVHIPLSPIVLFAILHVPYLYCYLECHVSVGSYFVETRTKTPAKPRVSKNSKKSPELKEVGECSKGQPSKPGTFTFHYFLKQLVLFMYR